MRELLYDVPAGPPLLYGGPPTETNSAGASIFYGPSTGANVFDVLVGREFTPAVPVFFTALINTDETHDGVVIRQDALPGDVIGPIEGIYSLRVMNVADGTLRCYGAGVSNTDLDIPLPMLRGYVDAEHSFITNSSRAATSAAQNILTAGYIEGYNSGTSQAENFIYLAEVDLDGVLRENMVPYTGNTPAFTLVQDVDFCVGSSTSYNSGLARNEITCYSWGLSGAGPITSFTVAATGYDYYSAGMLADGFILECVRQADSAVRYETYSLAGALLYTSAFGATTYKFFGASIYKSVRVRHSLGTYLAVAAYNAAAGSAYPEYSVTSGYLEGVYGGDAYGYALAHEAAYPAGPDSSLIFYPILIDLTTGQCTLGTDPVYINSSADIEARNAVGAYGYVKAIRPW